MSLLLSPFVFLLNTFYNYFNSYGIAILCFAVVVKVLLFPFAIKGKRGMIAMNMMSGKLQAIKKKCGKDTARYQQEVEELYAREKVNPMSGCLWTMLPLFVLIPLYTIIRQPIEHMLYLSEVQLLELANLLNWDTIAVTNGWATQDMITKAIASNAKDGFTIVSGFDNMGNNQLLLASLIPEGGVILADGVKIAEMNFQFLGINMAHLPNWRIWADFSYNNLASIGMVIFSAASGFFYSKIMQKTNKMNTNQPQNEQMERTNRTMMYTMPLMSLWIGFMMPAIMCLYWIANSLLSMIQEIFAGKILKKDYEKMRIAQEEEARLAKEEEKLHKAKIAEERERRQLEEKNNKGKKKPKPKKPPQEENIDKSASREGLRAYARGRAYDPNRYPNPHELSTETPSNVENPPVLEEGIPENPESTEQNSPIESQMVENNPETITQTTEETTSEEITETSEDTTENTEENPPLEDWSQGSVLDQFKK